MTLLFGFWCRTFTFDANSYKVGEATVSADDLHFSPWYMQKTTLEDSYVSDGTLYYTVRDECVTWGEDEDTKWNFVKAITIITPILGGILSLMVCMSACGISSVIKMWHCIAMTYIVVLTLFQGLGFLIFQSNACEENPVKRKLENELAKVAEKYPNLTNAIASSGAFDKLTNTTDGGIIWDSDCSWDKGSTFNVVAVVCWFLAGAFMLVLGAPASEDMGEGDEPAPAAKGEEEEEIDDGKGEEPQEQAAAEESGDAEAAGNGAGNDAAEES
jgi:hypothetical protein